MMFNEIISLVSLCLIFPTIGFALTVLVIWGGDFFKYLFKTDKNPMEWLIVGIVVAFFGVVINSLYWGILLSQAYITREIASPDLYDTGLVLNIIFKQIFSMIAGYCHIKSYTHLRGNKVLNSRIWFASSIIGVIYVMVLSIFKR